MEKAEKGYIYDFIEKDGTIKNQVLVVSSPRRAKDNIISIIMLGDHYNDACVDVKFEGRGRYINCDLVTYCKRDRLGRKYVKISDKKMQEINDNIIHSLDLKDDLIDWEKMYNQLLDKVVSAMGGGDFTQ